MGKTSGNRFLEQLGERVFHIFPKLHPIRGVTPAPFVQALWTGDSQTQPACLFLTNLNLMNYGHIIKSM